MFTVRETSYSAVVFSSFPVERACSLGNPYSENSTLESTEVTVNSPREDLISKNIMSCIAFLL